MKRAEEAVWPLPPFVRSTAAVEPHGCYGVPVPGAEGERESATFGSICSV